MASNSIAMLNSVRYRGYVYDSETGLYYLQSRYYDPETGRFLNADDVDLLGFRKNIFTYNSFIYCDNNTVNDSDPTGYWLETVLDVAGIGWSLKDFIAQPSWINLGYLVWDLASAFIPLAPGSYVVKGGKLFVNVADSVSDLKKTKSLTAGTYSAMRALFKKIKGLEVHHIIEKRFKELFKCKNTNLFLSIPVSKELHKIITKRWRKVFKYGTDYSKITKSEMRKAIKIVYDDMPALKKVALEWFEKNWKG